MGVPFDDVPRVSVDGVDSRAGGATGFATGAGAMGLPPALADLSTTSLEALSRPDGCRAGGFEGFTSSQLSLHSESVAAGFAVAKLLLLLLPPLLLPMRVYDDCGVAPASLPKPL